MVARIRLAMALGILTGAVLFAQPPGGDQFGPRGFGPPGQATRKILENYDKDKNGWLNNDERKEARESLKNDGGERRGPRGGFPGGRSEPGKPGPKVSEGDVPKYPDKPLYEPGILRTFFLTFENADWEKELEEFHGTDVDVPCTLTVDGKQYRNVGVRFRGMSSYMGVGTGSKRSLNLELDTADNKQRLYGAKSINLLNCHEDASFLSTAIYSQIARQYIPAPQANMARVVINGELWGIYSNVQQFDKVFLKENFKSEKGSRWKVTGSPQARGGLEYLGDDPAPYKRIFEIKTKDDDKAWKALINFCKVLNQTPPEKLEAALKPICDIEGLLWFLALDVAIVNGDGYWTRASDYSIYLDEKGVFHFIPHDMNEAFHSGGGPGGMMMALPRPGEVMPPMMRDMLKLTDEQKKTIDELQKNVDRELEQILTEEQRKQLKEMRNPPMPGGGPPGMGGRGGMMGPGGSGGVKLDPLVGLNDPSKPLRSKVLAVPALREKYLANVHTIAEKSLEPKAFGAMLAQYRALLEKEIEKDTRKLTSFESFQRATAATPGAAGGRGLPLMTFAEQRRAYLLEAAAKKSQ